MSDWIHNSSKEIERFLETAQTNDIRRLGKPNGLYFARGDQWADWCKSADWKLGTHKYVLDNMGDLKLLVLNAETIAAFHDKYDISKIPRFLIQYDWARVAEEYDGVIVEYHNIMQDQGYSMSNPYETFVSCFDVDTLVVWRNARIKLA